MIYKFLSEIQHMDRNIELEELYEYLTNLNYFKDLTEKGYHPTNIEDDENRFKFHK